MSKHKLFMISAIALLICIASAVIADKIPTSDAGGHPNWDDFSTSIWITVIITIPAFCTFAVTALLAIVKRKKK